MFNNYVFFEGNDVNVCFQTTSWNSDINTIKQHFFNKDGCLWQRNCPVWGEEPIDGFKILPKEDAMSLILSL